MLDFQRMGLSFHCPQCSQAVPALPTQMGQQVTCPACKAQFRLSPMLLGGNGQTAATKTAPVAAVAGKAPPIAVPVPPVASAAPASPVAAVVKMPPPRPVPAITPPPAAPPTAFARPPVPTVPPVASALVATTQPNVARFIAAASQDSTVQLTADGKLPELSLAEATAKKKQTSESNASPLVLGLALVGSTLLSLVLLVWDFNGGVANTTTTDEARTAIQEFYIHQEGPLLPYQVLLKDASLAHSLGKFDDEVQCYRRVRDMLYSESKNKYAGVTGTKTSDKELMDLLGVLLDKESR